MTRTRGLPDADADDRRPRRLMPHGYTNRTAGDGAVVTKSYQGPDAAARCAREGAVLSALAGRLPVPPVIEHGHGRLTLGFMPGVHGQDLIDRGLASQVLHACGRMLRRIHAVDPRLAGVEARGDEGGGVLVHGDYGPNNTLLDAGARDVIAIVDWEWAHAGDPVEDLAWCEWIVRMHHPGHLGALTSLFDGYGGRPAWTARHEAMAAQCRALLALCERWEPGGQAARLWQQRTLITGSWTE
jgi:aminoglycoside phosphotransferase